MQRYEKNVKGLNNYIYNLLHDLKNYSIFAHINK